MDMELIAGLLGMIVGAIACLVKHWKEEKLPSILLGVIWAAVER